MQTRYYLQRKGDDEEWETLDVYTTIVGAIEEANRCGNAYPNQQFRVIESKPKLSQVYSVGGSK